MFWLTESSLSEASHLRGDGGAWTMRTAPPKIPGRPDSICEHGQVLGAHHSGNADSKVTVGGVRRPILRRKSVRPSVLMGQQGRKIWKDPLPLPCVVHLGSTSTHIQGRLSDTLQSHEQSKGPIPRGPVLGAWSHSHVQPGTLPGGPPRPGYGCLLSD